MLTYERLRELLHYDPETGAFTWIKSTYRKGQPGTPAGCLSKRLGYILIGIDKRLYYAHRLAFLWMTKQWPEKEVDHINLDKADNRWANLRPARVPRTARGRWSWRGSLR